jgi:hypothetical protein
MTVDEEDDVMLRRLRRLPAIEPDAARAVRVRARCHATLERRRQRAEARSSSGGVLRLVIEPALVTGFCVSYLFALILDVIGLR